MRRVRVHADDALQPGRVHAPYLSLHPILPLVNTILPLVNYITSRFPHLPLVIPFYLSLLSLLFNQVACMLRSIAPGTDQSYSIERIFMTPRQGTKDTTRAFPTFHAVVAGKKTTMLSPHNFSFTDDKGRASASVFLSTFLTQCMKVS